MCLRSRVSFYLALCRLRTTEAFLTWQYKLKTQHYLYIKNVLGNVDIVEVFFLLM